MPTVSEPVPRFVVVAAAEGWVRSLSGSGVIGVTPAQLAVRVAASAAAAGPPSERVLRESLWAHAELLRDLSAIRSNSFHSTQLGARTRYSRWLGAMDDSRDYSAMPILADALQDAGCEDERVLDHCRGPGLHVRGCWIIDSVLAMR